MKKMFAIFAMLLIMAFAVPAAQAASSTSNEWRSSVLVSLATHTINIALYYDTPLTSATCTVYTTVNELATAGGYTAGGKTLTGVTASMSGNSAIISAPSVSWAAATFTTNAAMIYDVSNSNKCIGIMKFPTTIKAAATFTLTIPSPLITLASMGEMRNAECGMRNEKKYQSMRNQFGVGNLESGIIAVYSAFLSPLPSVGKGRVRGGLIPHSEFRIPHSKKEA